MKQTPKKQKKNQKRTKKGPEQLLWRGISLASLALCASLFCWLCPFTPGEIQGALKGAAKQAASHAEALVDQFSAFAGSLSREDSPASSPRMAASPEIPAKAAESLPDESIPHMIYSDKKGDFSDLGQSDLPEEDFVYSVMLDTAAGPMLYYNQGDSRWGDFPYGGTDPMKAYGCGPTVVAMLVNSFTPNSVTPVEIAQWAADNGYFVSGSGSRHSLIPDGLSAFGLLAESIRQPTEEAVYQELGEGHLLVALMGKGALTQSGHFIIITQSCGDGHVYIADPNNYSNCSVQWDLSQIIRELKNSHDSGGPLWAVRWP